MTIQKLPPNSTVIQGLDESFRFFDGKITNNNN